MDSKNPYSPPHSKADPPDTKADERGLSLGSQAKEIFLAWEKLRVVYNLVLVVFTLLVGLLFLGSDFASIGFFVMAFEGAVISNVCFFAGPVVETYACWLEFRTRWLRTSLFVLGLVFTAAASAITFASIGFSQLPNQS